MRIPAMAIYCLALTYSLAGPASAQEILLVKAAAPASYAYVDATDVIGIGPGKTVADVSNALRTEGWSQPSIETATLRMSAGSISVSSQSYPAALAAFRNEGRETVLVVFATPSTGGEVVSVERTLDFPDAKTAPEFSAIVKGLDDKYGRKRSGEWTDTSSTSNIRWVYNDKSQQACNMRPYDTCAGPLPLGDPSSLQWYRETVAQGRHLIISATITPQILDRSRVSKLTVSVNDIQNKFLTLNEAAKQMEAGAKTIQDRIAVPQKAPRL